MSASRLSPTIRTRIHIRSMSTIPSKPGKSVLISGGSIAGPALAWWLNRYGFKTTLVERWPELRPGGQNIDVNNQGREITRMMGIEKTILESNTGEKGSILTDIHGNTRLDLPLIDATSFSPTNETEILRGTFAKLLYDVTEKDTEWRFGDQITSLQEIEGDGKEGGVKVGFQSGKEEQFDLVVIADGVGSRTRKMAFPGDQVEFKPLGCYIAYFNLPLDPNDPHPDRWVVTSLPGRRCLSYRPDGCGNTVAFLLWIAPTSTGIEKLPIPEQITAVNSILLSTPLKSTTPSQSAIIQKASRGLLSTTDLYLEYTGQIKAKHLYTPGGKIGMIGDAAYCGTAMAGAGTTLSLVGAYVLAGELAKHAGDSKRGLEEYEKWMKPFAEGCQRLAPGVPWVGLPETEWGIKVLHNVIEGMVWVGSLKWVQWLAGKLNSGSEERKKLPDYTKYEVRE